MLPNLAPIGATAPGSRTADAGRIGRHAFGGPGVGQAGVECPGIQPRAHIGQIGAHGAEVGIPIGRVLGQRAMHDLDDSIVQADDDLRQRRRDALHDPSQHAAVDATRESLLIRQQLVPYRADGKDVAPVVDRHPAHLLRRHIVQRAHHRTGLGHVRIGQPGDAEIQNLQDIVVGNNQIDRLDIPVDNPRPVRMRKSGAQLVDVFELRIERQRQPALNFLEQRLATDVFHGDIGLPLVVADVIDGDDVGVCQPGRRPGFAREAFAQLVGLEVAAQEHLDGDVPIEGRVVGKEDLPIPPRPRRSTTV